MGKIVRMALVVVVAAAGVPSSFAADRETSSLSGTAYNSLLQPLPRAAVQIRNIQTGVVVASATSDAVGEFRFANLQPASYILELVDDSGRLVGMTSPFRLTGGMNASVSVVMVASGAAKSDGGGFSLFGVGPTITAAALGAAGAAGVAAVVTTRQTASPSR